MTVPPVDFIYNLLPQYQRAEDQKAQGALQALTRVLASQAQAIHANVGCLLDNWFIETCADWLVPYIGQQVGLDDIVTAALNIPAQRLRVAQLMRQRAGRGSIAAIAHAATCASGWPCMAVDMGARVARAQSMRDPRSAQGGSFDLEVDWLPTGTTPGRGARSVDVAPAGGGDLFAGDRDTWFQPGGIGIYVWRLQPFPLLQAQPLKLSDGFYAVHPLGRDTRLFTNPGQLSIDGDAPEPEAMPRPLSRHLLDQLLARRACAANGLAVEVKLDGGWSRLDEGLLRSADLAQAPQGSAGGKVLVDPVRGRLWAPDYQDVLVSYSYGFAGPVGGGPYDRLGRLAVAQDVAVDETWFVARVAAGATAPGWYPSLAAAMKAASVTRPGQPPKVHLLIQIHDNAIHRPGGEVRVPPHLETLVIQAANGFRPAILGNLHFSGIPEGSEVVLSGLLVGGTVVVERNVSLLVADCTIMPAIAGYPAILAKADGGAGGDIELHHAITGPIVAPAPSWRVGASHSIIDGLGIDGLGGIALGGGTAGPAAQPVLKHCTILGDVKVGGLDAAGENLIDGFVHLPGQVRRGMDQAPIFASRSFGDSRYCQLSPKNPPDIMAGAEDGGELGAFHFLAQGVRLANIHAALADSVPQGMRPGVVFVT